VRLFIRRFLDVDGPGANTLSAPNMGLGEFDEICAVLQCRSIQLSQRLCLQVVVFTESLPLMSQFWLTF
jgi:hypothetical protein